MTELSQSEGESINDGIRTDLCSVRYTSVEAVAMAGLSWVRELSWQSIPVDAFPWCWGASIGLYRPVFTQP